MKKFVSLFVLFMFGFSIFAETDSKNKFKFFDSEYFDVSPVVDFSILGTGATLIGTSILLENVINPIDNSCSKNTYNISDVNGFDRAFICPYSKSLDITSNVFTVAAVLMPSVLLAAPNREWGTMATMYGESLVFAWGCKELGKTIVHRARPYMYSDGKPDGAFDKGDFMQSFPSGHTTLAFTSAAFTTYAFCTYFPDSAWKAPVIAASYTLAVATAAFRVTSGKHFVTDVLVGSVIGTASGLLVPWLHSRMYGKKNQRSNQNVALNVAPNGFSVKVHL